MSVSAHVRGVVRPRVVISGGMLVGLLRRDPTARSILAHEYAHLLQFDRILPCIVVMILLGQFSAIFGVVFGASLIEIIMMLAPNSLYLPPHRSDADYALAFVNLVFQLSLLMFVSRRREYMADATAVALLGYKKDYIATLKRIRTASNMNRGSFFHPSLNDRIHQLQTDYRIFRPSKFWLTLWIIVLVAGARELALVAVIGVIVELVKLKRIPRTLSR